MKKTHNSTYNKNFILLFCIYIVACFVRIFFNKSLYIINIVSLINMISFDFIIFSICDTVEKELIDLLKSQKFVGPKLKTKKFNYFKNIINFICITLAIVTVIYAFCFANNIVNDVIGLTALFCSIETEYICESIVKFFYKIK